LSTKGLPTLFSGIEQCDFLQLDLSINNKEIKDLDLANAEKHWTYIENLLNSQEKKIAYGGYLETRNLYNHNDLFKEQKAPRNIHLGIDFWLTAGTPIVAPFNGVVHSFANNTEPGDYGPTIIIYHEYRGNSFYALYGHLSKDSLNGLNSGKIIRKGEVFAAIGDSLVNGGYAPHLHFQIIKKIGSYFGDYPGVCSLNEVAYFSDNCPSPLSFLNANI
jgi:murein DD-endopeptidase MepM/ murein hydrolase activator NlpD